MMFVVLWLFYTANAEADNRALLIGINTYESSEIPQLKASINDVATFRGLLIDFLKFPPEQIKELVDSQATKQEILATIDDWLIKGTKPGDKVVLFYSGHGAQLPDANGDEDDGLDESLIAYDSKKDHLNWVIDDEIGERIERLQGRKVLVVIDSCHSGTVMRGAIALDGAKTPNWDIYMPITRGGTLNRSHQMEGGFIEGGKNVTAFFAVAPNQIAFEDKDDPVHPHGVFTEAFVNGARGEADANSDQHVSYSELFEFIRERSSYWCQTHTEKCVLGLTPTREFDNSRLLLDIGEFVHERQTLTSTVADVHSSTTVASASTVLLAHTNTANLKLLINPGNRVHLGQPIRYSLHSERDGRLVIFDIDGQGKITQLFPNPYTVSDKHNLSWVYANRDVTIPGEDMGFSLYASEPLGKGKIVAILIEDPNIDTRNLVESSGAKDLITIDNPVPWMVNFEILLTQIFHEIDGKNRAVNWSVTEVDYEIVR